MKSDKLVLARRRGNQDHSLSRQDRYFLRTRDVHPLVGEWKSRFPERYELYHMYREYMRDDSGIDLTDIEIHHVACSLVMNDSFELAACRNGVDLLNFNSDQLRAAELCHRASLAAVKTIKASRRSSADITPVDDFRARLKELDVEVTKVKIKGTSGGQLARDLVAADYEVED